MPVPLRNHYEIKVYTFFSLVTSKSSSRISKDEAFMLRQSLFFFGWGGLGVSFRVYGNGGLYSVEGLGFDSSLLRPEARSP